MITNRLFIDHEFHVPLNYLWPLPLAPDIFKLLENSCEILVGFEKLFLNILSAKSTNKLHFPYLIE